MERGDGNQSTMADAGQEDYRNENQSTPLHRSNTVSERPQSMYVTQQQMNGPSRVSNYYESSSCSLLFSSLRGIFYCHIVLQIIFRYSHPTIRPQLFQSLFFMPVITFHCLLVWRLFSDTSHILFATPNNFGWMMQNMNPTLCGLISVFVNASICLYQNYYIYFAPQNCTIY